MIFHQVQNTTKDDKSLLPIHFLDVISFKTTKEHGRNCSIKADEKMINTNLYNWSKVIIQDNNIRTFFCNFSALNAHRKTDICLEFKRVKNAINVKWTQLNSNRISHVISIKTNTGNMMVYQEGLLPWNIQIIVQNTEISIISSIKSNYSQVLNQTRIQMFLDSFPYFQCPLWTHTTDLQIKILSSILTLFILYYTAYKKQ